MLTCCLMYNKAIQKNGELVFVLVSSFYILFWFLVTSATLSSVFQSMLNSRTASF